MPTGFGGSSRLALLTGMVSGMNAREETKRKREREDVLNQQAQQMIKESAARIQNYQVSQQRQAKLDQRAFEKQDRETAWQIEDRDRKMQSLDQAIDWLSGELGQDRDAIAAIVAQDPNSWDDLIAQMPDKMNALQQSQADLNRMKISEIEAELERDDDISDLLQDQRFGLFREALRSRNEEAYARMYDELKKDYPLGLDAWLDDNLPDMENDDGASIDSNARQVIRDQGKLYANKFLAEAQGNPNVALAKFNEFAAADPPTNAEDVLMYAAILDAINSMFDPSSRVSRRAGGGGGEGDGDSELSLDRIRRASR